MPAPHTHKLIGDDAARAARSFRRIYGKYSNYYGLGTNMPDILGYYLNLPYRVASTFPIPHALLDRVYHFTPSYHGLDYGAVSDIIHWENSRQFVIVSMSYIKRIPIPETKDKLIAFLAGIVAGHMGPDWLIHRKVYRDTRDHWKIHTLEAFDRHKDDETRKDAYYLGRLKTNPPEYNYPDKVACHKQGSGRTLDEDIFKFLKHVLKETYGNETFKNYGLDYEQFYGQFDKNQTKHPILDAYRDFITCVRWLWQGVEWEGRLIRIISEWVPRRVSAIMPVKSFKTKDIGRFDPTVKRRWGNSTNPEMPSYSDRNMFYLSVKQSKSMIQVLEEFFASAEKDAEAFLDRQVGRIAFLDEDQNFDTGLPSRFNDALLEIDKKHRVPSQKIALVDVPASQFPTLEAAVEEIGQFGLDYINKNLQSIARLV